MCENAMILQYCAFGKPNLNDKIICANVKNIPSPQVRRGHFKYFLIVCYKHSKEPSAQEGKSQTVLLITYTILVE